MSPVSLESQEEENERLKALAARQAQAGAAPGNTERTIPARGAAQPEAASAPAANFIAQHTVTDTDTLSHIALKYYGSAAQAAWMHIYEANKETIGANPGILRPGLVLNIPEKPAL